jgi:hypothetical protein
VDREDEVVGEIDRAARVCAAGEFWLTADRRGQHEGREENESASWHDRPVSAELAT